MDGLLPVPNELRTFQGRKHPATELAGAQSAFSPVDQRKKVRRVFGVGKKIEMLSTTWTEHHRLRAMKRGWDAKMRKFFLLLSSQRVGEKNPDRKYGFRARAGETFRRVMLHSFRVAFLHPVTGASVAVEVMPSEPELRPPV